MLLRRAQAPKGALLLLLGLAMGMCPMAALAQRVSRPAPSVEEARPIPRVTRPLPDIVADVQSRPPYNEMDYIGVAGFETHTMIYVLRFLDGRQVIVVRVDGRSGRIIGSPVQR